MRTTTDTDASLARRLAWFVGLWLGGVVSIGAVAMLIRWALHA